MMPRLKISRTGSTGSAGSSLSGAQLTDAIRKKAQELYEKSGRKPGRDMDNWLEAERIVKSHSR